MRTVTASGAATRDDGPLAGLVADLAGRVAVPAGGSADRLRLDPAALTVAGLVPVCVVLGRPGSVSAPVLRAGIGWLVLCAGAGAGCPRPTRLDWLVPPLLRAGEYGLIARLAGLDGGRPAAGYAYLSVLAFHHYDVVYRNRTRGTFPPDWLRLAGGGWDGRLLVACWLLPRGRLSTGLRAGAALLGALFLAESVRSWTPSGRQAEPGSVAGYADDEAEPE